MLLFGVVCMMMFIGRVSAKKLFGMLGLLALVGGEMCIRDRNIEATADAKGRVFIPATFRKQLQIASEEKRIRRKDVFQDCLTLYPESVWNEELNELRSLSLIHI